MEKDRQAKIITVVALLIGVATLTLGFAAFSARIVIQSKATVTPDAGSFRVLLSKEQNSEVVGGVNPTGNGTEAIISNNDVPTISNLKANFVNPGEKVVYELYAVNVGEYDAYLNKINYENIAGQTIDKICTAGENTTDSYVQSACNSIRVTIKVAEDDKACQTSTYGAHKLDKKTGEKVVVEIEYNKDGVRADGLFSVEFGSITLNYSTADTETKNVPTCTDYDTQIVVDQFEIAGKTNIVDADGDGRISTSDKVTLGTESFYVMSIDKAAKTVTMLAEWNLNVGTNTLEGTVGIQNSSCRGWVSSSDNHCALAFSSKNYWSRSVSTYPAWVYSNESNLYTHVNTYVDKLKAAGYSSVTGRLIRQEEALALGCTESESACNSAPSWVKNTSFWSGSASGSDKLLNVGVNGSFSGIFYYNSSGYGVRPVITINVSEI